MSRPSEPAHGSDGVSILPIPPALDFPYPRQSTESSVPASLSNAEGHASPLPNGSKTPSAMGPPKIGLDEQSSDPLPRRSLAVKERTLTERIPERRSGSTSRLRRRQTGAPMATFNPTLWNSESDFSSSSSDEDETRYGGVKKTSSFPRSGSQNEKTRHLAGRLSDDPYSRFSIGNDDYKTKGHVSKRDGRLKISVKETANRGYLAKALGATLRHHMGGQEHDETSPVSPAHETTAAEQPDLTRTDTASTLSTIASYDGPAPPKLNIVIMVIGSRGDIQPFLRLGKILKEQHGHRVRIATHPAFKEFVEKDSELEFFSVGGNPAELMAFMVKNPGLIPKAATIRAGEIAKRRDSMFEMFQGFWRACINETDDETDIANLKMMGRKNPFVADAIIANPPSFAHIHCAECLGIPFHLMFTFPTSPTQQFPHPLTKIKQSNVDANYTNFMSYPLVEMMTWQGLGDLVNRFRVKTLGLEPVSTLWAPGQLFRLRVPHTYLWSPGLIPKPKGMMNPHSF